MSEPRSIVLYDTQSQTKLPFEPIEPGKVKMYICGVTVYDLTHIGHARVYVFFDTVKRFFERAGYEVCYVRNHTDVDDKILARAEETGVDPLELSAKFIDEMDRDMDALGLDRPDIEPKVSDHIEEIIEMVQTLIDKGFAYESGGDVYYRVESFDGYGKLSRRKLEDMEAGRSGRVTETDLKEHPFDFALWKGDTSEDSLGWDSPFGRGRPGWHIECSAMSMRYLGDGLDIHGGGRDLIFPHHENEIAQSEAATGHAPFAKYWMHVGMVNVAEVVDGEAVERKMSKSLGNFWTTRDVLGQYHPEAVRYFMHTTVYRNPITYSMDNLEEATCRVEYLYFTLDRIDRALKRAGYDLENPPPERAVQGPLKDLIEPFEDRLDAALADDFNTPNALALISELARASNECATCKGGPDEATCYAMSRLRAHLLTAGALLGFLRRDPTIALRELRDLRLKQKDLTAEEIDEMIVEREQARAEKDWVRADQLRDRLDELDVEIMDSPEGTTWRIRGARARQC